MLQVGLGPGPVRVGEIGGPRFSFHKGQEFDPADY